MSCSCKAWESLITSVPSRWRRRPRRPCLRSISGLSARTPNVLVQVSGGEGMPGGGGGGGGGICVVGPAWRIELGGSEAWDVQLQHVAHDPAEDGVPLLDAALPEHASTEPSLNRRSSALEPRGTRRSVLQAGSFVHQPPSLGMPEPESHQHVLLLPVLGRHRKARLGRQPKRPSPRGIAPRAGAGGAVGAMIGVSWPLRRHDPRNPDR